MAVRFLALLIIGIGFLLHLWLQLNEFVAFGVPLVVVYGVYWIVARRFGRY